MINTALVTQIIKHKYLVRKTAEERRVKHPIGGSGSTSGQLGQKGFCVQFITKVS